MNRDEVVRLLPFATRPFAAGLYVALDPVRVVEVTRDFGGYPLIYDPALPPDTFRPVSRDESIPMYGPLHVGGSA